MWFCSAKKLLIKDKKMKNLTKAEMQEKIFTSWWDKDDSFFRANPTSDYIEFEKPIISDLKNLLQYHSKDEVKEFFKHNAMYCETHNDGRGFWLNELGQELGFGW